MINFKKSLACRFAACLISFVVIQTAPGLAVYQAIAQVRTAPVGAGGNGVTALTATAGVTFQAPASNLALPVSTLGLGASIPSVTNVVPTAVTPSVAVNVNSGQSVSVQRQAPITIPLSFRPSILPAAAKGVAVDAAAPISASPSQLSDTSASLTNALSADNVAPSSEPSALITTLRNMFDGSFTYKGTLATPALAAASIGDSSAVSVPSALAASSLSSPKISDNGSVPAPPASNDGPKSPSRSRVTIGLALAGVGAAAGWYTSAWAAAVGGLLAPFVAVPALALTIAWITLGTLSGFAAFSVETWKGFPSDLKTSSLAAAAMTFKFWARFGLIFDSVLRGKTADMSAPTPASILKYPVIAWVFVVAGYVMSPVALVLGAAYRLAGTPFIAAFRGAREVIVGFLPWMARVFRFIGRFVVRIFPFAGGLVWGAVKSAGLSVAAGAAMLAAPIGRDAFYTSYKPASLPGWIGYRLTQAAALAAILVVGALGAVVGLISSPLHVVMGALDMAFRWSGVSPKAEAFFRLWTGSINNDVAFEAYMGRSFPPAGSSVTLGMRVTRVFNGAVMSLVSALALPLVSLAIFVRATLAASRGEPVRRQDTPNRVDESGAEAPVAPRPGFTLPAVLGAVGAVAAVAAVGYLMIAPLTLLNLGVLAASAVFGAGVGFALSQPQAWSGWLAGIAAEYTSSGSQALGGWFAAGEAAGTAVTGQLQAESGLARFAKGAVSVPFAIPGVVATVISLVYGVVHGAASKPVIAAWTGFMAVITQFLPVLKRFFNWALRVAKDVVPFFFGFVFGSIWGVLKSGWFVSTNLFRPLNEIFGREDKLHTPKPSEAQIGFGVVLGLTLVVPALAAFAGAFVVGAIVGLPVALTHGLALAVKWAGTGDASERYFKTWQRNALPQALRNAVKVVEIKLSGEGAEMPIWRLYVRAVSFLVAAIPSTLALLAAGGAAYIRSLRAAKADAKPEAETAAPAGPDVAPLPVPERAPVGKPPVWLAASLGAVGLAAGLYAGVHVALFSLPFAAGWLASTAVVAGLSILGVTTGLAVSQPVLWKRLIPSVGDHAKAGFGRSLNYWSAAGKAAGLTPVYALIGGVLGAVWAVAGAGFGVVAAGSVAAYEGARQVVYEILPFLRTAFETAMKVLRRMVPFVFGLLAGLVSGVVGSAAFGALLLGRPYFKHVVADDFKHAGALGFLGNLLLKAVAGVLGVIFGLVGVVAGVLAALPYALTASVSLAFRFADIGGPAQKFFDHWTYGALRAEMQRLNQLTDRFQFPEGEAAIADGWIRVANVLPATIAAAFAATIAGWVGYFRSLVVAHRSAKSGGPIPEPVVDQEAGRRYDSTWRASKKAASSFFAWGIAGGVIGLGIMLMTSWTPLGIGGWLLVAALAAVGVAGALALGAIIATVALFLWINGQLR